MTDERGTVISDNETSSIITAIRITTRINRDKSESNRVGGETGCQTHLHILSLFLKFHHL